MYAWTCVLFLQQPVCHLPPPQPPPSKTSTNLWGLGGGDSFQQRLTVLSLLCVPLITVSPSKAPGLTQWPPCHGAPACGVCLGKAPNLAFPVCSSLHLSVCACSWAATAATALSQCSPALCGSIPQSHQNRAFHWLGQDRTAHLAAARKLAPGRAPVPISWPMVQANTLFLGVQKEKAFAIS